MTETIDNGDHVTRRLIAFLGIYNLKRRFCIAFIKICKAKRLALGVAYEPHANLNVINVEVFGPVRVAPRPAPPQR